MIVCPNCNKRLRDGLKYCRICGSALNGDKIGDFSTDMLNVFKVDGRCMYLFCENGNQVILGADSMDELATLVQEKRYPWQFKDWKGDTRHTKRQSVAIPKVKTEFLKASSLKEVEVIPTFPVKAKKDGDESYVPEYVVEKVVDE